MTGQPSRKNRCTCLPIRPGTRSVCSFSSGQLDLVGQSAPCPGPPAGHDCARGLVGGPVRMRPFRRPTRAWSRSNSRDAETATPGRSATCRVAQRDRHCVRHLRDRRDIADAISCRSRRWVGSGSPAFGSLIGHICRPAPVRTLDDKSARATQRFRGSTAGAAPPSHSVARIADTRRKQHECIHGSRT